MSTNCSIYIVKGYHETTPVPDLIYEEHLTHRFAVIFDTYRPDLGYMHFNADLFLEILHEISNVINYDALLVQVDDDIKFKSIDYFSAYLLKIPEEDRLPPRRIYFRKNGKIICLEETEFWAFCGGPYPYSDSFTASFYMLDDKTDSLEVACFTACQHTLGGVIKKTIHASAVPIRLPLWKRLLRKLR